MKKRQSIPPFTTATLASWYALSAHKTCEMPLTPCGQTESRPCIKDHSPETAWDDDHDSHDEQTYDERP